jgi:V/A-type H+/Na+-transporting ATPase subunit G/H
MELVKRIKKAEEDANKIINDAREDAASELEKAKIQQELKLSEKEGERKEIIESRCIKAENEASKKADEMRQEAQKKCEKISEQVESKMEDSVSKVIEFISSLPEKS